MLRVLRRLVVGQRMVVRALPIRGVVVLLAGLVAAVLVLVVRVP
jgi:hypothetical protein